MGGGIWVCGRCWASRSPTRMTSACVLVRLRVPCVRRFVYVGSMGEILRQYVSSPSTRRTDVCCDSDDDDDDVHLREGLTRLTFPLCSTHTKNTIRSSRRWLFHLRRAHDSRGDWRALPAIRARRRTIAEMETKREREREREASPRLSLSLSLCMYRTRPCCLFKVSSTFKSSMMNEP